MVNTNISMPVKKGINTSNNNSPFNDHRNAANICGSISLLKDKLLELANIQISYKFIKSSRSKKENT